MKNTERTVRCRMTREMNKPDWHEIWKDAHEFKMGKIKVTEYKKQRVLNPDVAEFVNELNKRLENKQ